jgi:hypothetical protein
MSSSKTSSKSSTSVAGTVPFSINTFLRRFIVCGDRSVFVAPPKIKPCRTSMRGPPFGHRPSWLLMDSVSKQKWLSLGEIGRAAHRECR